MGGSKKTAISLYRALFRLVWHVSLLGRGAVQGTNYPVPCGLESKKGLGLGAYPKPIDPKPHRP